MTISFFLSCIHLGRIIFPCRVIRSFRGDGVKFLSFVLIKYKEIVKVTCMHTMKMGEQKNSYAWWNELSHTSCLFIDTIPLTLILYLRTAEIQLMMFNATQYIGHLGWCTNEKRNQFMDIIYLFQYFFGWLVVGCLHFIYDLNSIRGYAHITYI